MPTDSITLPEDKAGSKFTGKDITFNQESGKLVAPSLFDMITQLPQNMQNFISTTLGIQKDKGPEIQM